MVKNSPSRTETIAEIVANINALKHKMFVSHVQKTPRQQITHSQWFVLCIIEAKANVGIKEISEMLGITSSATTQLVDALAESGLVERKTNAKDRRSLHLCLSKKGQKGVAAIKETYASIMKTIFDTLSDRELQQYNQLQKKILINASKSNG